LFKYLPDSYIFCPIFRKCVRYGTPHPASLSRRSIRPKILAHNPTPPGATYLTYRSASILKRQERSIQAKSNWQWKIITQSTHMHKWWDGTRTRRGQQKSGTKDSCKTQAAMRLTWITLGQT